ncbi:MAG: nuclear transport factor 2 family protein [Colwelliaceae bacterium]|jgi:ketosteroid isomerase-like protein|nr:nuclear transport factor 2 family protein [Colwelliaceae bacterium]
MLKSIILSLSFFFSSLLSANDSAANLEHFAQKYFDLWTATQLPDSTPKDIDKYLDLLAQNVGHQHLPYDKDDSRNTDGKKNMKKGMLYYLGAHTEYSATLTSITLGHNVVVIKYDTVSKGFHPQLKKEVSFSFDTTEVLEIENGKVSVIRKYSE